MIATEGLPALEMVACRAQNCRRRASLLTIANPRLLLRRDWAEGWGASLSRLGNFWWLSGRRRCWLPRTCARAERTGSSEFAPVDGSLIGAIRF
jgi:hypothetical protein